jgi:hypothetical protein
MKRPVMIHAILLIGALTAAYFVWTRGPERSADEISILNIRAGLDRAVFTSPDRVVEVNKKKDDQGSYYAVKVETWEKKPPEKPKPAAKAPDAGPVDPKKDPKQPETKDAKKPEAKDAKKPDAGAPAPPAPPKPPEKVRKIQTFKGNKGLDELMKGLATFSAIRSLGVVDAEKLKLFSLTGSKKSLTLVTGSAVRVFIIGGNTFGSMDSYLQDKQDKRVYVVRPRLLQDFQYAEFRLMDRELHAFGDSEIDRVVFSTAGGKKTLLHKNRRDPSAAFWVDAADPEKKKDFFRNWMGRFNRLRVVEYSRKDKAPAGLNELFSAEYFLGGKKKGHLRWFSGPAATPPVGKPQPPTQGGVAADHYVMTEHTRVKVKVASNLGDELTKDLANLLKE